MTQFSKWKTIGYAVSLFVVGAISGGALGVYETKSHLFAPVPEREMESRLLHRLRTKLDLTEGQVAQIQPIIRSAARDIRSIHFEAMEQTNKVLDASYAQLAPILTPEQRKTLDEMQKERHALLEMRIEAHHHPMPAGPDGPGGPDGPPPPNSGTSTL